MLQQLALAGIVLFACVALASIAAAALSVFTFPWLTPHAQWLAPAMAKHLPAEVAG